MHFLPILHTLKRHRTAATLIVLEIALTCAIVSNAIFLIRERLARMDRPTGMVDNELVVARVSGIGDRDDAPAITQQDLAALREIPGVKAVAATNMIPFGGSSWNSSVSTLPDDPHAPANAAMYLGTPDLLETMGLKLIAGRDFNPEEYLHFEDVQKKKAKMSSMLITKTLGEKLFPGQNPLGQKIYVWGDEPLVVVGVVDHLARPNDYHKGEAARYAMFFSINAEFTMGGYYLLRVDPARKAEVVRALDAAFDKVDPNRIVLDKKAYLDVRGEYFKADKSMAWLLAGVCIALLIITALGVIGLASFWVQQRTRQIGVRRALGATRGDILRYFQTENFILATLGIIIGMGLAYGINLWLMSKYQVARLPAEYLPIGAALLWLIGQVAVLGPALRASMIPPAVATRSV